MDTQFWKRFSTTNISVDQLEQFQAPGQELVERFYLPVGRWLLEHADPSRRLLVAVAGPPGSGKSTFCAVLSAIINAWAEKVVSVVVGQDGWHFSNAYLGAHSVSINGKSMSMRLIKGRPESFDVPALKNALMQMKTDEHISFPVYSRLTHDPQAGAGLVSKEHQIVLVEGNYLLLNQPLWSDLIALFDCSMMILVERELLIQNLRARHIRGGKDAAAVDRQIESVDIPNIDLVLSSSSSADLEITVNDRHQIASVNFTKKEGGQPPSR